jgi:putative redox protein
MAHHESELRWREDLKFDVLQNNKLLLIDCEPDAEKSIGFKPKALILSALAGCTACDVVEILNKKRVSFSDFSIKVKGELTEEHPKSYHKIELVYQIKLEHESDRNKMEKAVQLSQQKYCGVTAMVEKFAKLKVEIKYL